LLPVFEEAQLARHVLEPVGHGFEERDFVGAVRSDFLNHPPLELRALGFPSLALDSVATPEKAAEMDEGAAGTVEQAVNWAHQAVSLTKFAANPARIEQILFAEGSIIGIDDRGGLPLALAAERDLDVIGRGGTRRREHEGAGAAPFGDVQVRLL
jgi:hypothetical protein